MEQWACSRIHPTFVITTFTGLDQHSILVSVLSVPTNEDVWSPRLRVYLNAITKFHTRKEETPLGTLVVTNLSGFPSTLNIIVVPDGDVRKHRADFFVNENLKRMNCSGRAGLNLSPPIEATQNKFVRLYKTSDRVPILNAVIELVKLCQVALLLFGKLAPEYADGLLCDVTEQAIKDWWTDLGTEFFNIDPSDGVLGPTTVAAILGILLGARNRLNACGAPVGKDVFDLASTKRGIASFQKSQKLERTRRLDRPTLEKLHKVSAKAASGQGWTVPRAVKSTVAELSGKGGDVVMGMVGGREKIGIAEIETLDIETFVQLAYGERCKWLWHGKPRKNNNTELFNSIGEYEDGLVFSNDDHGGYVWESARRHSPSDDHPRSALSERNYPFSSHGSQTSLDPADKDTALRRTVLKSVTDKITDARSGLGRIKEAVGKTGIRGHYHKYSKDSNIASDGDSIKEIQEERRARSSADDLDTWVVQQGSGFTNIGEDSEQGDLSRQGSGLRDENGEAKQNNFLILSDEKTADTDAESLSSLDSDSRFLQLEDHRLNKLRLISKPDGESMVSLQSLKPAEPQDISDLLRKSVRLKKSPQESDTLPILRTTISLPQLSVEESKSSYGHRWPRHLSFSAVVDVVALLNESNSEQAESNARRNPDTALVLEEGMMTEARLMGVRLQHLKDQIGLWVQERMDHVNDYDSRATRDQESLDNMYRQNLEEYHSLQKASDELLAEEKTSLTERIKDVDTLGAKLEYELTVLQSKVEDVESGVAEFERHILGLEKRAEELRLDNSEKQSWQQWALNFFIGNAQPVGEDLG